MNSDNMFAKRNILFFIFCIVLIILFYPSLKELMLFSLRSTFCDYIVLIPFVSGFFFFINRKSFFTDMKFSYRVGILFLLAGLALLATGKGLGNQINQLNYLSLMTASALIFFYGSFLACYGTNAFKKALFPLLFLIFMIPIPTFLMEPLIKVLLFGSTAATDFLFSLTGTAYIREGNIFYLPGITIEVAKVCSGIRSTLALFITMILAGHLFLQTGWRKVILLLAVFPLTVFKNGVRIVTITLLATYVDEKFLTNSHLHHSGGYIFFIPSLMLLGILVWLLRRSELKR